MVCGDGTVAALSSLRVREEGPMLRSRTGGRSLPVTLCSLQCIVEERVEVVNGTDKTVHVTPYPLQGH